MDSISRIEMHNTPTPRFSVEPVGEQPSVTWHVDWERMEQPSPKVFDDVSEAQVTLALIPTDAFGDDQDLKATYETAMGAINELLREMAEVRLGDTPEAHDLYMGNLDVLPEVSTEWPPGQQTLDEVGDAE